MVCVWCQGLNQESQVCGLSALPAELCLGHTGYIWSTRSEDSNTFMLCWWGEDTPNRPKQCLSSFNVTGLGAPIPSLYFEAKSQCTASRQLCTATPLCSPRWHVTRLSLARSPPGSIDAVEVGVLCLSSQPLFPCCWRTAHIAGPQTLRDGCL